MGTAVFAVILSGTAQAGSIIGIYRESAAGTNKHFVGIDAATGGLTDLATQPYSAGNPYNLRHSPTDNTIRGLISDSGSKILSYDIGTMTASLSPVVTTPAGFSVINFTNIDRDTGTNYAVLRNGTTGRDILATVNPTTGVMSRVHPTNDFDNGSFTFPQAGAFDSDADKFIFLSRDPANGNALSYFSVDAALGTASVAAVTGSTPNAMGYDTGTSMLYGLVAGGGTGQFISINPGTGASSNVGSSFDLAGWDQTFTIDHVEGTAIVSGRSSAMGGSDRALFMVDLTTGVLTTSPTYDPTTMGFATFPNGLVAVTIPEPSAISALGLGAALLLIRRKRA